ncbi:putative reverse transcriptase domain-containing protein [Tanacetum coccineum]
MQTNETVNELWKKFNDLILYSLEYHDDLLSRARVREADLLRIKNKEAKETKRKLEFGDRDTKKPKHDHGQRSGTILVNFIPARVLYDSGASFSFVSYKFSKNLSTLSNKLLFPLEVEISNSKVVVVFNVYRDVEIEIDDSIFRINLIPVTLGVFDIVIGMDWLDKYNATILCSQKLVRVVNPQAREIIIYGDKRKDTSFKKKSAKDVPVVNEFLDVFPKDLPVIPPERQVEF